MTTAFRNGAVFASTTNVATGTTTGITTISGDAATLSITTTQTHPVSSVLDFYGNTYNLAATLPYTLGGATYYMYEYTCPNIIGGINHTATVNLSGGGITLVFFFATWSGVLTSGTLLDGVVGTHADGSFIQSHPGATMTTAQNGSIIIQHAITQNSATEVFTAGAGYTIALSALGSGASYNAAFLQYKANATAGSQTAAYTTSNFDECGEVIFALAPPAVGAQPIPAGARQMFVTETIIQY